jgi:undecaprenyl diphosphate synthase
MNELNHIAFIMDGNGRWGQQKKRNRNFGHLKGVDTIKKIIKGSIKLKIPIVSFYVFSTENWKRPKTEVKFLFKLINSYFSKEIKSVIKQGVKINIIGEVKKLSKKLQKTLNQSIYLTRKNKKIIVNLAINYGSKKEIINTFKKIKKNINVKNFEKNLYTKNMPNPDIMVRTGGQKRLSNFMLWQLAYTELFFLNKLWPDFQVKDLKRVINIYKKRKRNFGKV